jgi:hypothetical protein
MERKLVRKVAGRKLGWRVRFRRREREREEDGKWNWRTDVHSEGAVGSKLGLLRRVNA